MSGEVKPIPDGEHAITPHLVVGDANAAIAFYVKGLGATESHRMADPTSGKVMHAAIRIGDSTVFLSDEFPQYGSVAPTTLGGSPVTIHLYVADVDAVFNRAVEAGATAVMPPMDMFWGDRYGKIKDPSGHNWSLATHIEDVPPQEMATRMQAAISAQKC